MRLMVFSALLAASVCAVGCSLSQPASLSRGFRTQQEALCTIKGQGFATNQQNPSEPGFRFTVNLRPGPSGRYVGTITINDLANKQQFSVNSRDITAVECFPSTTPNLGQAFVTAQITDKGRTLDFTFSLLLSPGLPEPFTTVMYTASNGVSFSHTGRLRSGSATISPEGE